jgi:50S ribosomal protein L16 3-hydroxylase
MSFFGSDLSVDTFLCNYWQKKPLLLRNAFPNVQNPLSPDELAGLACEPGINARIIFERAEYSSNGRAWSVQHGPFNEDDFAALPETGWSLLVSDVEKQLAEARSIIEPFRFIPDWRIDDLMISYAPPGASVGAHVDAYDVFLLQLHGTRRWMISEQFDATLLQNTDMRILANFMAAQSWELQPGDMLYLPPGVAHHGVAVDACMTASIGFRAPSLRNMVSEYGEFLSRQIADDIRYTDPNLQPQSHPAEITAATIARVKTLLQRQLIISDTLVRDWLGEFASDNRSVDSDDANETCADFATLVDWMQQATLEHNSASRFLYSRDNDSAVLFVDGQRYPCSLVFAETLCRQTSIDCAALLAAVQSAHERELLLTLYRRHSLVLIDE